jgi:hypothetical protein
MILGHPLLRRNVAEHRRGPSRAFRLLRRTPPDGYYPTILLYNHYIIDKETFVFPQPARGGIPR